MRNISDILPNWEDIRRPDILTNMRSVSYMTEADVSKKFIRMYGRHYLKIVHLWR